MRDFLAQLSSGWRLLTCNVALFALSIGATAQVYEKVFDFTEARAGDISNKGAYPEAPLVKGNDGNFYGTTKEGGADGAGTIFRMTPAGVLTTLVEFNGFGAPNKGRAPNGLVKGSDGNFYGTTTSGGSQAFPGNPQFKGDGTVFRACS